MLPLRGQCHGVLLNELQQLQANQPLLHAHIPLTFEDAGAHVQGVVEAPQLQVAAAQVEDAGAAQRHCLTAGEVLQVGPRPLILLRGGCKVAGGVQAVALCLELVAALWAGGRGRRVVWGRG